MSPLISHYYVLLGVCMHARYAYMNVRVCIYVYVCVSGYITCTYVVFLTLFVDSLSHRYTTAQAEGLRQNLLDRGYSKVKTYFAMRYWEPYTEDVSTSHAHAHLHISLTHSLTH
jgi:hypothetical protein